MVMFVTSLDDDDFCPFNGGSNDKSKMMMLLFFSRSLSLLVLVSVLLSHSEKDIKILKCIKDKERNNKLCPGNDARKSTRD